jgi:hypothetical protein
MKLAKAPQEEIDRLMNWLQARERDAKANPSGPLAPPPFLRVVFGYETLVQNVCDPAKDYLDFKPGYSPSEVDTLRENYKRASTSFDKEVQRLAALGNLVTQDRETKAAFIERVKAIINA